MRLHVTSQQIFEKSMFNSNSVPGLNARSRGALVQAPSSKDHSLEKLRLQYKPARIVLLLVGESPPPHRGFFYDHTAPEGQLSRNTRKLFQNHYETNYPTRQDFLVDFKTRHCYLVDLFQERGKTIHQATRDEKKAAVNRLSTFLRKEEPKVVVSVLKRISKPVEEAVQRAHIKARCKSLPYPTRHYVKQYSSGLGAILRAAANR